jgi:hypothetical protein
MTIRTARRYAAALAALLSLAVPSAFGLDEIGTEFGNNPVSGFSNLTAGQLAILNDSHRVYLYHVQSDGFRSFVSGYFQGDTAGAQSALRRFAALDRNLNVVLLPGPREVTSFSGKEKVSADWEFYISTPSRFGRLPDDDARPILYLYVRMVGRPAVPAPPEQVARWLKALDAEEFEVRDRASGELEKQGAAVTTTLRKALEQQPSAEARRRIGLLLEKLERSPGVNLDVLVIPEGVRVLGPEDLLARNRAGLKSDNLRVRGEVAELMTRFGPDPAALATQIEMVSDKEAYTRQHAAAVLGRMGKAAAPALPALRARLDDPVPFVRNSCQTAIASIEAAEDDPGAVDRAKKAKAVREEITRVVKSRRGEGKEGSPRP